jgi:hypothetical protein
LTGSKAGSLLTVRATVLFWQLISLLQLQYIRIFLGSQQGIAIFSQIPYNEIYRDFDLVSLYNEYRTNFYILTIDQFSCAKNKPLNSGNNRRSAGKQAVLKM